MNQLRSQLGARFFPPSARAGAICPKCGALLDVATRHGAVSKLREHYRTTHRQWLDDGAALALTVNLCECGGVGTIKVSGESGFICTDCADKQKYRDMLQREDADYGRPTRDAALQEDDNPGHCLPEYAMPGHTQTD